jgi:hypothetical protein
MDEIQRAKHDTPFIAGGKVMYAPRRPHTRGSRALTGMEMDVIPLVTGARDSVEHATSLSSPRRKPHPSWTPHVKLTAHPTFGNKYHGHHLHVHHNNHGHEWKEKNKKFDDRHDEHGKIIHKHHHHRHSQGHHGHHGHKKRHPKTLRECLLSHETDISVLVQAYKTEQLKFPPSWKEAADKAEKEAQQVEILRDNTPVAKPKEQHNVYEIEAHVVWLVVFRFDFSVVGIIVGFRDWFGFVHCLVGLVHNPLFLVDVGLFGGHGFKVW